MKCVNQNCKKEADLIFLKCAPLCRKHYLISRDELISEYRNARKPSVSLKRLFNFVEKSPEKFPIKLLEDELHISYMTAKKCLNELENHGFLRPLDNGIFERVLL